MSEHAEQPVRRIDYDLRESVQLQLWISGALGSSSSRAPSAGALGSSSRAPSADALAHQSGQHLIANGINTIQARYWTNFRIYHHRSAFVWSVGAQFAGLSCVWTFGLLCMSLEQTPDMIGIYGRPADEKQL